MRRARRQLISCSVSSLLMPRTLWQISRVSCPGSGAGRCGAGGCGETAPGRSRPAADGRTADDACRRTAFARELRVFEHVGRPVHLARRARRPTAEPRRPAAGCAPGSMPTPAPASRPGCASRASPVANRASSASSGNPKTALAERQSASVRIEIDAPFVVACTREDLVNAGVVAQLGMAVGAHGVGDVTGVELIDDGLGLRDVHAGAGAGPSRWISAASAPIAVIRPTTWSGKTVVAS